MNRIMKSGIGLTRQAAFRSRLSGGALTFLAIAALMFAAANANAACGALTAPGSNTPIKLPLLAHAGNGQDDGFPGFSDSIVGLWHVVYTTSSGATFNETLDQWHIDGTEFENAWLPPDIGNICFGVWKLVAPRTVRLHHIGWTFTPGSMPPTASGTFTLDETNTVSRDGKTYTGTFTFKTFDITGASTGMPPVTGTIAATRITVD